jgi:cation transport protein ChaC
VAFRIAPAHVSRSLDALWQREMRRGAYHPRLLHARLPGRTARVLAFVANPKHPGYAGTLPTQRTAELIANCHGDRGPNVEYLARTLKHLADLGVRDHHLLRVMAAVRALEKE